MNSKIFTGRAPNRLAAPNHVRITKSHLMPSIVPLSRNRVHLRSTGTSEPVSSSGGGNRGDIGSGGSGGGGNGGSGGSSGGDSRLDPALATILLAAGRKVESFPSDFAAALLAGKVTADILKRFLEMEANFLLKLVWGIQGFRERLLGDPSFPIKVAIECGIGVVTKVTAEKAKREDNFWNEIDFVGANVVMAIIADFMLTWLPAPTLSYIPKSTSNNAIMKFFSRCPDNAFQKVPPGMDPFTIGQRFGAILRNGSKLIAVGFFASLLGVGITNGLTALRRALDPAWAGPPNPPQDILATSAAYGVYMSISSNLRYQIVAGIIEERGIETIFKGQSQLCHLLSFIIRTGNTFVGSLLWVDFVRLCGMQKAAEKPKLIAEPQEERAKGKK
ncbi:hypothetical protein CEUSTIGMA_g2902.t1 [Chlamydomonas eustigma]|uniref:Uncharacterized protein n=1 Tax=Chlamydomonas eustigma TaxID=1157962 RepID=A0A250WXN3_9CHLO|nr:hypothetical protein CEUSTIGMA_g2902.t1 [Chlamydomonas eustigma]|eukprot:GAX75459.1 hypothetical protein CEUSTIGMA_g2902.t1 [Chlamydomonas eustigma]